MLYQNIMSLSTCELDAMGICPENDISCPDLKERLVFYHDENCYMPEPMCDAIARAGMSLRDLRPYRVTKTSIDFGFRMTAIRSFATEAEAIDFMLAYDGDGDCLHLRHGQMHDEQVIGYVDLWERELRFVRSDPTPAVVDTSDVDLPF